MIGIIIAAVVIAFILLAIFLPVAALSILAFILFVLLVVLLIPVGVELSYLESQFSLAAKLSFYSYKLLPKKKSDDEQLSDSAEKKKPKKEKKPKDSSEGEAKKPGKKLQLNFEEIIELIKKALKGLGKFGKLKVHKFTLHYIAAGKDPYSTSMTYNYVNAALSSLAPCCAKCFIVKGDVDVWTDIDFTREKMLLDAELSITLKLIQVVHVALVAGFGVLGVLIKNKIRLFKEKRAEKKTQANNTADNKENNNIQTEERMDSNG